MNPPISNKFSQKHEQQVALFLPLNFLWILSPDFPSSPHTNLQRMLCKIEVFAQSDEYMELWTVEGIWTLNGSGRDACVTL